MKVAVEGLTFAYPGAERAAVNGLTFGVDTGEVFGFLGPSGAGKSTTQKILIGLLKDYEGQAKTLGREVSAWRDDLYERVGVSFELPTYFSKLTAIENLDFFGRLYQGPLRPALELLDAVGLAADAGMTVGAFSKGMKVRLGLARALLHSPEILFLDEPTAGLDPVNSRRVRELVRQQRDAGCTVFLTTHDMVTASELCDRVAFIVDGQIALIGAPRQLKIDHGRRQVLVEYSDQGREAVAEFELDTLGSNAEFSRVLTSTEVRTVHSQEATLEQVFVEVTGRTLE